ncbi:hypothetical protein ABBQ32_001076 [Trebouxia sp. C0010 RCD-2024]
MTRIRQDFVRDPMTGGVFIGTITSMPKQTVQKFRQEAERCASSQSRGDGQNLLAEVETAYWNGSPGNIYGADNQGSLFSDTVKEWKPATLKSSLSRALASDSEKQKLKGVHTPYLYYGMWKSTFAWHTEDMDLHSLNYLHHGAPQVWYCVPPSEKGKMDAFIATKLPTQYGLCREFLRHKHSTLSCVPDDHDEAGGAAGGRDHSPQGGPASRGLYCNFPGAYHVGFNTGFNCAESTNFATRSWIEHGAAAHYCKCSNAQDSVYLDMAMFFAEAPSEHIRGNDLGSLGAAPGSYSTGQASRVKGQAEEGWRCAEGCKGAKAVQEGGAAHSRAKQSAAGNAGSRETASMLKMAKYAGLAPSAAAKLPHLKAGAPSSHQAPSMSVKGSKFPARPRGQPKGSEKALITASTHTDL